DNVTSVRTPRITGGGAVGDTITIYEGANLIGSGVVQGDGTWTITVTPFTNNVHNLTIKGLGGTATTTLTVTISNFADVDQDNHVNISDVSALQTALNDLNTYKANHNFNDDDLKMVCDINLDGFVDNADVQALIIYLANGNTY